MEQFVEHDLREKHGSDVEQLYERDPEHHPLHVMTTFRGSEYLSPSLLRSEEREKGWFLTSKLIFSELGMVNERFFANQNICKYRPPHTASRKSEYFQDAKKYYQRLGAGTTEQVWTTEMVEEVDIFEGNDLDEDGWDDWD